MGRKTLKMEDIFLVSKDFGLLKEHESFQILGLKDGIYDEAIKKEWVIINVITRGTAKGTINGHEFCVKEHDMMMVLPYSKVEPSEQSEDLCVNCLCISKTYMEKIISYSIFNWDVWALLQSSPVLSLDDEEYERFILYYKLIYSKMGAIQHSCYNESVQALMKAFMFDFYAVLGRYIEAKKSNFSQRGNLFRDFMRLISETYPRPRSVIYYSKQLDVTPKYLSAVCKQNCGSTASTLIHKMVSRDIHELLTESNKSIKEIMEELDFPSLSFFGKYVKKHLGKGPKEYRAAQLA